MNEDSVCDAFKPAAQLMVPRVINPAVLITFVVWLLHKAALRVSVTKKD